MALIKAKQLDIETVGTSLTNLFTTNTTQRDDFVQSIKDAPDFNDRVLADVNDDTTPGFLSQKIIGDPDNADVVITTSYDNILKKVKISTSISPTGIVDAVAALIKTIQYTATVTSELQFSDSDLVDKRILYLVREHLVLFEGIELDDYMFDDTTGTVTFNTGLVASERIKILYI